MSSIGGKMVNFGVGYLYSFAPIHCGGESDLGNILEIAREVHTNFPYIPGSSLRGSIRNEVLQLAGKDVTDRLFGRELENSEQMGVHQVWFGDARLLWVPMRTMSMQGNDVFTWVTCHSLLRDHALISKQSKVTFSEQIVGDRSGQYTVADVQLNVSAFSEEHKNSISLVGNWHDDLNSAVKSTWERSRIVLPDADFQVLLEHSLWTQVRNKIQPASEDSTGGSAEIFWTDVCIPRDTIFYYTWGYNLLKDKSLTTTDCDSLKNILTGLLQVGGQANVGRGWVQSWIGNEQFPVKNKSANSVISLTATGA
jgi:CRISPR-associated protein Cmr4